MANVKQLRIEGEIPFSVADHEEITRFLGQMNGPCFGINIHYGTERLVKQPNGGELSMYRYYISGEEAVRNEWIENLLEALINCGATVEKVRVIDMENDTSISFLIPVPDEGVGKKFKVVMDLAVMNVDKKFTESNLVVNLESLLTAIVRQTVVTPGRSTYPARFELNPGFLRKA